MRRIDIVLAVLFVALVVGIVFLPDLIAEWRAAETPQPVVEETPPPAAPETQPKTQAEVQTPYDPDVAIERVSGQELESSSAPLPGSTVPV